MDGFETDRKLEKETYAMINYFKVLTQLTVSGPWLQEAEYNKFYLIGGLDKLEKLADDCKIGLINLDTQKNITIKSLLTNLQMNYGLINDITVSKSTMTLNAMNDIKIIEKIFKDFRYLDSSAYAVLYSLIPQKIKTEHKDMLDSIRLGSKSSEKVKKLGEK